MCGEGGAARMRCGKKGREVRGIRISVKRKRGGEETEEREKRKKKIAAQHMGECMHSCLFFHSIAHDKATAKGKQNKTKKPFMPSLDNILLF